MTAVLTIPNQKGISCELLPAAMLTNHQACITKLRCKLQSVIHMANEALKGQTLVHR